MRWRMVVAAAALLVAGWSAGTPRAAVADESPGGTTTAVITAQWPNPELLIVGYTVWNEAGTRPDNSGGAVAANSGGCESDILPLTVSVGAPLVESGLEANDPGTYVVEAWFVGYCDQPSFDVVDTARAAYPEGSTIPVTIQVAFQASDSSSTGSRTLTGDVPVVLDDVVSATLGQFTIGEVGSADDLGVVGQQSAVEAADDATNEPGEAATGDDGGDDDSSGIGPGTIMLVVLTAGIAGILISSYRQLGLKRKPPEIGRGGGIRG